MSKRIDFYRNMHYPENVVLETIDLTYVRSTGDAKRAERCSKLIDLLQDGDFLNQDRIAGVEYILDRRLTEKQGLLIRSYYKDKKTLSECAKQYKICIESCSKLITRGLNTLGLSGNVNYIIYGLKGYSNMAINPATENITKESSVMELALYPRCRSSLMKNGIHTVEELLELIKHPEDFHNIFGIGPKSVAMILDNLVKSGLITKDMPEYGYYIHMIDRHGLPHAPRGAYYNIKKVSISWLLLPNRIINAFVKNNIKTIGDLFDILWKPDKLAGIKGLGIESIKETIQCLCSIQLITEDDASSIEYKLNNFICE